MGWQEPPAAQAATVRLSHSSNRTHLHAEHQCKLSIYKKKAATAALNTTDSDARAVVDEAAPVNSKGAAGVVDVALVVALVLEGLT